MNIIQKQPNESGAYGQVYHSFLGLDPSSYYEIASDITDYCTWNGYITPTIENGVVTSYVCNTTAWNAWKAWVAEHQPPTPQPTTEEQIATLKAQLSASDYKVIKCAECSLAGLPLPYDIATLHAENQAIRDQINALESSQM